MVPQVGEHDERQGREHAESVELRGKLDRVDVLEISRERS